ncbi:uncharacterized protein ACMZJ9_014688 isoform 1-T1 [Mantella aurantiaca]
MYLIGCTALLLLLGVIIPVHTADPPECNFTKNAAVPNNHKMSISPEVLSNGTEYTVTITVTGNGTESVEALFQAQSNNTALGTWSPTGKVICPGGTLHNFILNANNSLVANWTSPSSSIPDSVDVKVSIRNGNVTYTLSKTLNKGSGSGASLTQPPPMFLAILETLGLLVITSKLL